MQDRRETPSRHRLGGCSWSIGAKGPAALVAGLHACGLDGVQLALDPLVVAPSTWSGVIDNLRGEGIEILSGMMAMAGEDYSTLETIARTGGVRPDATWPSNLERAGHLAALAAEAGIDLVTFHAGFLPAEARSPERTLLLDRLRTLADCFAESGVNVALETGQERADTLLGVLGDLDHPGLGVNFDPANMILYAMGDPVEALRVLAPHVRQVHVKDALPAETPGTWGREVPAGEGAVDWGGFLKLVLAVEPPVNLVIEREAGETRLEDMRTARTLVMRHFPRAVTS